VVKVQYFGTPEINNLQAQLLLLGVGPLDHYIVRFKVSVYNAEFVHFLYGIGQDDEGSQ